VSDPTHFEDFAVGDSVPLGAATVSESAVVAFAEEYDPQPMHTDPEAAAEGPWEGLIASGWHVAAVTMRLLVEGLLAEAEPLGALGVDELRWRTPVRPGDRLHAIATVADTEPWDPRPEQGLVHLRIEATNRRGETALSMVALVLFARRERQSDSGASDGT
jgi:acyl dehydratase